VRRLLRTWKDQLPARYQRLESLPDFDAPAPRQAVWWLLKPEELEPNQKEYVSELQRLSPEISSGMKLVKEFPSLLIGKQRVSSIGGASPLNRVEYGWGIIGNGLIPLAGRSLFQKDSILFYSDHTDHLRPVKNATKEILKGP